jgi:hypothetical protein
MDDNHRTQKDGSEPLGLVAKVIIGFCWIPSSRTLKFHEMEF